MAEVDPVSKEQCVKVLEKLLHSKHFTLTSYSTELMAEQYEGMIGEQYKLTTKYNFKGREGNKKFFLKILNGAGPLMLENAKSIQAFQKEATYYQIFIPAFKSEGIDVNFVPKCYLAESYAIVLEDLSLTSYKGTSKRTPLNLEHCKKCLDILAKFHTSSIIYEENKTNALGTEYRLSDDHNGILTERVFTTQETVGAKFTWCTYRGILDYFKQTNILEDSSKKNKFLEKLSEGMHKMMSPMISTTEIDFRNAILHRDLWSNNFLFKYENNKLIDAKLIDFQTITYGPPSYDVLLFIFTNTRKKLRDEHINDLLGHYYKFFNKFLVENNVEILDNLSEVRFLESCEETKIRAKMGALFDRSITVIPDIEFAKAAETEDGFRSFLFEERGHYIIEALKNNEEYRELINEDIIELYEMMCTDV